MITGMNKYGELTEKPQLDKASLSPFASAFNRLPNMQMKSIGDIFVIFKWEGNRRDESAIHVHNRINVLQLIGNNNNKKTATRFLVLLRPRLHVLTGTAIFG